MGGCRCTYRNCTVRSDKNSTDTKTHLFHYPAYERLRCHQWIVNAQRYEFLDLKVSQLRNRVVCQHHFRDECFMNYKKEKLTFDAIPTEDGPYCDITKKVMVDEEALEKAHLVLNEIEPEATYIDKKANSSLKYIDFLANVEPPMISDGINSLLINNSTEQEKEDSLLMPVDKPKVNRVIKVRKKYASAKEPTNPFAKVCISLEYPERKDENLKNQDIVPKDMVPRDMVLRDMVPRDMVLRDMVPRDMVPRDIVPRHIVTRDMVTRDMVAKDIVARDKVTKEMVPIESVANNMVTRDMVAKDIVPNDMSLDKDPNIIFNNPHEIKNISDLPVGVAIPVSLENIDQINFQTPVIIDNPNQGQFIDSTSYNHNYFTDNPQIQPSDNYIVYNQSQNSLQRDNNHNKRQKDMKVKILSEQTLLKSVPFVGKLEPVLPSSILPVPNRLKSKSSQQFQTSQNVYNNVITPMVGQVAESVTNEQKANKYGTESSEVMEKNDSIIDKPPKIEILEIEYSKPKTSNSPIELMNNTKEANDKVVDTVSKSSLLKNKVSPERLAAIEKKRIFNKKLRDMVESCLEKPNDNKNNVRSRGSILKTKDTENVDISVSKDNPSVNSQDYTISYLEARMKKMETLLLKKIEHNSNKIMELKNCVAPDKRSSVSTQTPSSEESFKVYLYDEISKYLSPKAKNVVYEDLFIYKYSQNRSDCDNKYKRRRYR